MPAGTDWTTADLARAFELQTRGYSYRQIGISMGRTMASVRGKLRRSERPAVTEMGDDFEAEAEGSTLPELMDEHGLDPALWDAEQISVTEGRTWARFKRNKHAVDIEVVNELRADMLAEAREWPSVEELRIIGGGYMLEIDLFDHHFGSLVWGEETIGDSWDVKLAETRFADAFEHLLGLKNLFPISKILFPIGNDLVHFEPGMQDAGSGARTVSGTLLDSDTRYKKVYRAVRQAMTAAIERAAEITPVHVVVVPGNHGGTTEFTIGDSLECWFRNHPNVVIDNSPPVRKYVRYENNLLGFTHGHGEKLTDLPQIMAEEAARAVGPGAWEDTEFREWHIGHRHRRKDTLHTPVEDYKGVIVRELPSLTPPDAWHFFRGYVGSKRGATAFLWHPKYGPEGIFSFNAVTED